MNLDYSKVTHEQLLEQFKNRIISDPKFKDMSAAAIYQMYMEMMAGTFDMLHFYLGRTAEEMFLDSAKLDSSVIKLAKNLGYNPKRAIPATANIAIQLKGPLPRTAAEGDEIWFNNEKLQLKFNNKPYRLDHCYSYTLTADDIANGVNNPNWTKTIQYSVPNDADKMKGWIPLSSNESQLSKIKIIQCEIKTAEIYAVANAEHLTEAYQYYDIDDIKFSNYYGKRDPFALEGDEYKTINGWCKVGIGLNKTDAFSEEKICDIEIENIYCNAKVKAANEEVNSTKKLNVCRIESNQDKTVRISFGDGAIVNNGFNNEDEILYVQYVVTDGYSANTPDVIGSVLSNSSRIMAHGAGKLYDITDNITFVLTTNISNGDDFESLLRMKNSAAVYFASRGQLINMKDFNDYFSSMSRPIHAKTAVAWHTNSLKRTTNTNTSDSDYAEAFNNSLKFTKNVVFYTVIGDLYESLGNNQYKVKMLYTDNDTNQVGMTTLYNNTADFLKHIKDLAKCCSSLANVDEIITDQRSMTEPFYMNTHEIYDDIEEKLQFGVVPISIPPIVQYFDLVGSVELDRTANVANYKQDIESKIYKWLVDRQKFNNKIYKSDIIKLIYDNAATKSVNVDITPSSLTRDTADYYRFDNLEYEAVSDSNKPYITGINGYTDNVIVIPIISNAQQINSTGSNKTTKMSVAKFNSAQTVKICITTSTDNTHPAFVKGVTIKRVQELEDGRIYIELNDSNYNFGTGTHLWIGFETEEQAFSDNINFSSSTLSKLASATTEEATVATPVMLPYTTQVNGADNSHTDIHKLTYLRRDNKYELNTLTEKSFNTAIVQCDSNYYQYYNDCYATVKHVIEDNILDDNNNIVNFTLPNEIAVLRVKLTYTYGR